MMQETHSSGIPGPEHREADDPAIAGSVDKPAAIAEIGGRGGLEPTRYGDWEKNGRCIDF